VRLTARGVLERVRLARENARLARELVGKNAELERTLGSLRAVERRARHAEQLAAIGRMIAMIAHDLRTPLSVIRAAGGELLRESEALASPSLRELGSEVLSETDAMQRMCSELLEVTRVSEGVCRFVEADLGGVVTAAVTPLAELAAHSGIQLDMDLAAGVRLLLDPDRVQRALRNLVQNACEAMPGGGLLRVVSRREGDAATLEVIDNGPGIPAEIADRLFEPFVSAGKSGGSGLGLAVVRKVVEDHGGSVAARKAEGGGTAIQLTLPLAPPRP
jgi:signal transduction histidine kinase